MKFDRSNKFDLCYYGQVNSLRLKSSAASKWASKHLWGNIYFAGDGTSSGRDILAIGFKKEEYTRAEILWNTLTTASTHNNEWNMRP